MTLLPRYLIFVLYDMENEGIRADGIKLKEYGDKLAVSITELEKKIGSCI